eukprot:scaffold1983_cov376-Prasinococcus_capsulatus_cf.AAC.18
MSYSAPLSSCTSRAFRAFVHTVPRPLLGRALRHAAHAQRRRQVGLADVVLGVPQQLHQPCLPRLRPHRPAANTRPSAAPRGEVLRHTRLPHLLIYCPFAHAQRRRQLRSADVILGVPHQLHQPRLPRLRPHRRAAALGSRPCPAPCGRRHQVRLADVILGVPQQLYQPRLSRLRPHRQTATLVSRSSPAPRGERCRQVLTADVILGVAQQLHHPRLPRLRPQCGAAATGSRPGAAPHGVVHRHTRLPHLPIHSLITHIQRRRQVFRADVVLGVPQQLHQPRLSRLRPHRRAATLVSRSSPAPRGEVLRHTRLPHLLKYCIETHTQRPRQVRSADVVLGVPQQLHQPRLSHLRPHRQMAALGSRADAAPRGKVLRHTRLPHLRRH